MKKRPESLAPVLFAFGALAACAAAVYFGTGLHPIWWLTWLAPLPVLLVAPRIPGWGAFLLAFAAWTLGSLNMWGYYHTLIEIPVLPAIAVVALPSLVFAGAVYGYRARLRRGGLLTAALFVPAVWVAYEYVTNVLSPHGTFGNLGYSQLNFLPLLQIASITGIWGIDFSLFFFAAVVAALLSGVGSRQQRTLVAVAGIAWFVAVLGFGGLRLLAHPDSPRIKVGLIASDMPDHLYPKEEAAIPVYREYAAQIDAAAAQGAQLVMIPEKTGVVSGPSLDAVDQILKNAADRNQITVMAGVLKFPGPHNEVRFYSPSNLAPVTYDKHHLLPAFESDEVPGVTRTHLDQASGRWGIEICKDMDFPRLSRQYGMDDVGLLLVPAWDFVQDGWLHGRMAILRGVESGFSIARGSKQGILTLTDDRGRVLAEQASGSGPFTSLIAEIPVHHDATVYARLGDWFAWADLVLLLALLLNLPGRVRRAPAEITHALSV